MSLGLISLLNGMSIFVSYLMTNLSLLKKFSLDSFWRISYLSTNFSLRLPSVKLAVQLIFCSVLLLYSCYTNISRNIIKHNIRTSMNERIHFFVKICLPHCILKRVMFVVCERWVRDGDRLLYWPKFFSRPLQHFFLILVVVALLWVTEGPKPSVCRWLSLRHLVSNQLERSGHLVILLPNAHLLPLFFHLFTLEHLLIDGSVESQYITLLPGFI